MKNEGLFNQYETIKTELYNKVLIITLNRPNSLNAVNSQMTREMDKCLQAAEMDPGVWAIVITGSGRAFCAGVDLKELSRLEDKNSYVNPASGFAGIVEAHLTKPIIAAVNGLTYGGGLEIVLKCDLVIAVDTAMFALPEVKRGLIAAAGGLLQLPRQVPLKIAMMMALTGEEVSAKEMERWGVINKIVPQEQLLSTALNIAERITSNAPIAVRASKQIIFEGLDLPLNYSKEAWDLNAAVLYKVMNTEDAKEGPLAFSEKRSPVWKGL